MESVKIGKRVVELIVDAKKRGTEQEILLLSDPHIDNPKSRRDLFFKMLDDAKKRKAKVIINGDFFCFMQGKYDGRRSKGDIRPEHNKADYFSAVINDTVEIMKPYKDVVIAIGLGNHETAIIKNLEIDPLAQFIMQFNHAYKANIIQMPYNGWVFISFKFGQSNKLTYKIKHNHGYGGAAPVTHGTIQHSREISWTEGADAIWMGHTHSSYIVPIAVERLANVSNRGYQPVIQTVYMVRTPSFKPEYKDAGWAVEKGIGPKVLGGIWLKIKMITEKNESRSLIASYTPDIFHEYDPEVEV